MLRQKPEQILESLSVQFTIFEADGHYARNIAIIVAFGVFCRVGYMAVIYVLTKMFGGQTPAEPSESYKVVVDGDLEGDSSARGGEVALSVDELTVPSVSKDASEGTTFRASRTSRIPSRGRKGSRMREFFRTCPRRVRAGEVLAIVGPSGAGKTILLDTLTYSKGPGAPQRSDHARRS